MIDVKTVKFMKMLEELAKRSKNGIEDFAKATRENRYSKIFYDTQSNKNKKKWRIVEEAEIDDFAHHNAIRYFGLDLDCEVILDYIQSGDGEELCVKVNLPGDEDIYIENGEWYFVEK